jgi:hypothetical protein
VRRLVIGLTLLAAVLLAADFGARAYAQSVVGSELENAFDLSEDPDVAFGGFPFLVHALTGNLPSVEVHAQDFREKGVRLESLGLTLRDVRYPVSRLIGRGGGTVKATRGDGSATLTVPALNAALKDAGSVFTVRISGGQLFAEGEGLTGAVGLVARGDSLTVTEPRSGIEASIALPAILPAVEFTGVRLEEGGLVVEFELQKVEFKLSG